VSRDEKFRLEQKFSGVLVGVLIFGLVWFLSKKVIKLNFFIKNKTETGSNRPVSVRFGFLEQKPVQTGLARFFRF